MWSDMRALPRKAAGLCCSLTTQPATDAAVNNGDFVFRKCQKVVVPERKQIEIIKKCYKKLHFGVDVREVTGSSPVSSTTFFTRKAPKTIVFCAFLYFSVNFEKVDLGEKK